MFVYVDFVCYLQTYQLLGMNISPKFYFSHLDIHYVLITSLHNLTHMFK